MFSIDRLIKYLLEGLAVAIAAYLIPRTKISVKETMLISLTAAAVFAILDQFAPSVAVGARQGAGFGIGFGRFGGMMGGSLPRNRYLNYKKHHRYEGFKDYEGEKHYVTTLDDDQKKEGSLRYHLEKARESSDPYVILFKISGTIENKESLDINGENIIIDGEGKITLYGNGMKIKNAKNIIVKNLRIWVNYRSEKVSDGIWVNVVDEGNV